MRLMASTFVALLALVTIACDKAANKPASPAANYEGQGAEVSSDPVFEIKLKIGDGAEQTFAANRFAVYQTAPPKNDKPQAAQGWELKGDTDGDPGASFVIAGKLPEDLKLAPQRKFDMILDKPLTILSHGGDPTMAAMSKITLLDQKVYRTKSGSITVNKVFHKKGEQGYAGVTGTFEFEAQEIKLGDSDDPNSKGDQPVGSPVKASGTFTSKAGTFPFEQL